jgi:hypothetical protein
MNRIFDAAHSAFEHAGVRVMARILVALLQNRRRSANGTRRRWNDVAIDFSHEFASCKNSSVQFPGVA